MSQNIFPITVPLTVGTNDVTIPLNVDNNDVTIPLGTDSDIRPMPDITIGEVETLATGEDAYATMTGTSTHPVLNLGLPEGPEGPPGQDYNLTQTDREEIAGIVETDLGPSLADTFVYKVTNGPIGAHAELNNIAGAVTSITHGNANGSKVLQRGATVMVTSGTYSDGDVSGRHTWQDTDGLYTNNTLKIYDASETNYLEIKSGDTGEASYIGFPVRNDARCFIDGLSSPVNDSEAANKKYVDDGLATKQNTLTIETKPLEDNDNPISSGGVYTALTFKQDKTLIVDVGTIGTSGNPVREDSPYPFSINHDDYVDVTDAISDGKQVYLKGKVYRDIDYNYVYLSGTSGVTGNIDFVIPFVASTGGSPSFSGTTSDGNGYNYHVGIMLAEPLSFVALENVVSNKRLYDTIDAINNIDSAPTQGSSKPVTSDGITTALAGKQDAGDYAAAASGDTTHAALKSAGIMYGECDNTSTSTAFTATIPGITSYYDGLTVMLKNGVVTSAANFTIDINGLGAKGSYSNMATGNPITPTAATRDSTIFNINYTMLFVYSTSVVSGGAWIGYRGYNSDTNTIAYQLRTNSTSMNTVSRTRYYRILFTSADNTEWVPANTQYDNSATSTKTVNQEKINPFGRIVYMSGTTNVSEGSAVSASVVWDQYALALGYSFNRTGSALTLTAQKPVYVMCAPQTDGSAIMDSTTPIVQDLPTTADGKIYIYLGMAYSATNIELVINHPVYHYYNGCIRLWTGPV